MARARLILNGKAADEPLLRLAVQAARARGHTIDVRVTFEPGDAPVLVAEAVASGIPRVVAAGGDGTLHEVLEGVMALPASTRPELGLLPLGTANDFARAAELPESLEEALVLALEATASRVDVLRVGERWALNVVTGGFGTEVTATTSEDLKRRLGSLAYFLTGIARFSEIRAVPARIEGPGFVWEGRFLALGIGNGRDAGGGHRICPDARIDDGQCDLVILPEGEGEGPLAMLMDWLGRGQEALLERTVAARLPWVRVVAPEGLHLNLDGEPLSVDTVRVEVQPRALAMALPAGCPLLAQSGAAPEATSLASTT